jgi:arylsulfatase A
MDNMIFRFSHSSQKKTDYRNNQRTTIKIETARKMPFTATHKSERCMNTKSLFVLVAVLGLASAGSAADNTATPALRPNFVVINIDDLGYGDIGPYGSTLCRTPNLDRMAQEGRKLTSYYAAPVCSPSRASLMTGCYPKRVLPIPGVLFPGSAVGLNPKETTVAEVLKAAGYATGMIGKWHLGDQPEFLPRKRGFDYYFGLPYSNDMGPAEEGVKSSFGMPLPVRKNNAKAQAQTDDETGIKGMAQPPLPLVENEQVVERVRADVQTTLIKRYTEKALQFIRDNQKHQFFLYLPHNAVHFPHYPSEAYRGKSQKGLLGDWIQEVDWSVGQVLNGLRELKLSEKTLVIFTSDNGGPINQGGLNLPLRGGKGSTLEGGMRVCTIAWWPGKIPAHTATDEITSMMDILPTFAALAGGKIPAGRKIDGGNIWPVLSGAPGAKSPHEVFHYYRGLKLEAVRSGPWKLQLDKEQLYNLQQDIGEATNLAAQNPEIVQRLKTQAQQMKDDLGLDGVGPGCRELGRVTSAKPLMQHDGTIRPEYNKQNSRLP